VTHVADVTIAAAQVTADHANFPVYIDLSDMPAEFWSTVANGGGDIRVFASDGTTERAREVVSCDTATDTGELHVLIPFLSSSSDTVIQIHADGTSSEPAFTDPVRGRNAVWSGAAHVWHLKESSGTTSADSTGNQDGTYSGGLPTAASIGQSFDGVDDHVELGAMSQLGAFTDFTVQVKFNVDPSPEGQLFAVDESSSGKRLFQLRVITSKVRFIRFDSSGNVVNNFSGDTSLSATSPAYWLSVVFDNASGTTMYLDGASDGSNASTAANQTSSTAIGAIGVRYLGAYSSERFNSGDIGEVRFWKSALSPDWITDEYTNKSSPSTVYTVTGVSASAPTLGTITTTSVTSNSVNFSLPVTF